MIMLITLVFIILLPITAAILGGTGNSTGFHIPSGTGEYDNANRYGSFQRTPAYGSQEKEDLSERQKGNEAS